MWKEQVSISGDKDLMISFLFVFTLRMPVCVSVCASTRTYIEVTGQFVGFILPFYNLGI